MPFFLKQWGGVRKKLAGRELEGTTFDEFPQIHRSQFPPRIERMQILRSVECEVASLLGASDNAVQMRMFIVERCPTIPTDRRSRKR